ncbi:MAG: DUF692 domain-containing protein [Polyangiaceae bacterium]|nr:DUF692 domain-containing protein [Polyangiaceae bacterium]
MSLGVFEQHSLGDLGIGVGARIPHYDALLSRETTSVDWVEVISENFFVAGGEALRKLDALRERYTVVPHGVSLSIGGPHSLREEYLRNLRRVLDRVDAPWFSDHLCWGGTLGGELHELLPLPFTEETIEHVASRIREVSLRMQRPFVLENVSSYMSFQSSEMSEWEFVSRIADQADCGLLVDCNNIYVSSKNHGLDANAYIDALPIDRIVQVHLAGHSFEDGFLLDTHSTPICEEVLALYERLLRRVRAHAPDRRGVTTLLEWDEDIPPWSAMEVELKKIRGVTKGLVP